ncbi:hypothetical protein RDI58_006336 [Solanum bulbocastanum]|uniref:Uncharacterized protein n=1 Tax=Solanum bulbocastanum TaxID=147425 RepID=A0AAN8U0K5_SOLBU
MLAYHEPKCCGSDSPLCLCDVALGQKQRL